MRVVSAGGKGQSWNSPEKKGGEKKQGISGHLDGLEELAHPWIHKTDEEDILVYGYSFRAYSVEGLVRMEKKIFWDVSTDPCSKPGKCAWQFFGCKGHVLANVRHSIFTYEYGRLLL